MSNLISFKIPTMRTIKEMAKLTNMPENFIRRLVAEEKIVFVHSGVKVLINVEKFIEFLNNPENNKTKSLLNDENKYKISQIN